MFQRQAFVGGQWVPENELEWRHVDLCDGCGQIIKEPMQPFHFRVAIYNRSEEMDGVRRTTHPANGCVRQAIIKLGNQFLDSLEGWPS